MNGVALVTGASRGIGAAVAEQLAGNGYVVWCAARTHAPTPGALPGSLRETARRIRSFGGMVRTATCDINRAADVARLFRRITVDGPPSLVVHCAMTRADVGFTSLDPGTWRALVGDNIDGLMLLTRHCQAVMSGGSMVVLTSAMADPARPVPPGYLAYATAKAATERFVTAVAPHLAQADIAINAVRPGAIRTERAEAELGPGHDWSGWRAPESVLPAVLFCARQRPSRGGVTGQIIAAKDHHPGAARP